MDLAEIGGEFGLPELAGGDILVRLDNLAPGQQTTRHLHGNPCRLVPRRSSLRWSSVNFVRRIVSRILPSCSAVSPAPMASIRRRMESSARSASS